MQGIGAAWLYPLIFIAGAMQAIAADCCLATPALRRRSCCAQGVRIFYIWRDLRSILPSRRVYCLE